MPPNVRSLPPVGVFLLLFPLGLFKAIVAQTNLYAMQLRKPNKKCGLPLTVHEFSVWIGLHMKMMKNWGGRQDLFFSSRAGFDARDYMSRRRFYWIKFHLHFADRTKRPKRNDPAWDPLYLLRPLITTANFTFRRYWRLSTYVSLDEMMLSFRGSNPFHRYIPRKPHPNGFKLHAICDAKMYFCVAFLVDDNISRTVETIACELFRNNVVPGMTVITDRFYTCSGLVRFCVATGVGLIGSTKTRNFMAKHVLTGWTGNEAKKRLRGEFEVATNHGGQVACIVWKDKGIVRFTCTSSASCRVTVRRRLKHEAPLLVNAPLCAKVYDSYFHGVDRNDQLRGCGYGLALTFRARKYTVKFFLGFLDVLLSNTWILWRSLHPKDIKEHAAWFNRLTDDFMTFNPLKDPVYRSEKEKRSEGSHQQAPLAYGRDHRRKQADCPICTTSHKRKRTTMGCATCNVGLCSLKCFLQWHDKTPQKRSIW